MCLIHCRPGSWMFVSCLRNNGLGYLFNVTETSSYEYWSCQILCYSNKYSYRLFDYFVWFGYECYKSAKHGNENFRIFATSNFYYANNSAVIHLLMLEPKFHCRQQYSTDMNTTFSKYIALLVLITYFAFVEILMSSSHLRLFFPTGWFQWGFYKYSVKTSWFSASILRIFIYFTTVWQ